MLGKMLIHGLVAAAVVGSAAAVYAQVKDNGYLTPQATQTDGRAPVEMKDNGYIRPATVQTRRDEDERDRRVRSEHRRDRFDRKRDHDDDDD